MMGNDMDEIFFDLLRMTRDFDPAPDWAQALKLSEEVGEVSECILKGNGFLQHKALKEDVLHEVADVMNTCCGLLTAHYPDRSPEQLLDALTVAMIKKGDKYAKVLGAAKKG